MDSSRSITRVDLAVEQLDVALELFLSRRSAVSALTLASAAEEVLGRALVLQGQPNVIDQWQDAVEDVWGVPYSEYVRQINSARNAVKHLNCDKEMEVSFDPNVEAVWMLCRACENYERLGFQKTDKMWQFEDWYHSQFLER